MVYMLLLEGTNPSQVRIQTVIIHSDCIFSEKILFYATNVCLNGEAQVICAYLLSVLLLYATLL